MTQKLSFVIRKRNLPAVGGHVRIPHQVGKEHVIIYLTLDRTKGTTESWLCSRGGQIELQLLPLALGHSVS